MFRQPARRGAAASTLPAAPGPAPTPACHDHGSVHSNLPEEMENQQSLSQMLPQRSVTLAAEEVMRIAC